MFAIDFESFYDDDYSVSDMGVDQYASDPRFSPYWTSVEGPGISYSGPTAEFNWSMLHNQPLWAHNARFDETLFLRAQELGIIPPIQPASWSCSADLVAFHHGPRRLMDAAQELLGLRMEKETRDMMKGHTLSSLRAQGLIDQVSRYAALDSVACLRLVKLLAPTWPEIESRVARLNRKWCRTGVTIDQPLLQRSLDQLKKVKFEAAKNIPWEWDPLKTPLQPTQLRLACRDAGIPCPASLAADSEECAAWEEMYGGRYPWVGAMRDWRRSNILLKRLEVIDQRLRPDGTFPYEVMYFGAHTGRFAGRGSEASGFNMQNMLKEPLFGVDLRSHIVARPGYKLLIVDYAQIEARITLWLARDLDSLEIIGKGTSVYEAHAIRTMGYDPARGRLKDVDKGMYALAKARVLALGFQCGAQRFQNMAFKLAGVTLDPEEAKQVVYDFRSTNPLITARWNEFQGDLVRSRNEDYEVTLPSGRSLVYFAVRCFPYLSAEIYKGSRRTGFYGGKILENVVQAIARDVLVDGMCRLDAAGFKVLFHVHDEVVLEVPEESDPYPEVREILRTVPDWLEGCPIDVEGQYSPCYLK